jgi:hypothetical protein
LYTFLGNARSSEAVAVDTGIFCVTVLFVVKLSVFRRIAEEMYVMVMVLMMMSGSLRTQDYSALQSGMCVCACVRARAFICIRNVIG